ncbi:MAG: IucA/IucC family protein [Candidatus Woesearchaeota archaeon]
MKLERLVAEPIRSFIYLERYANFRSALSDNLLGGIERRYSAFHGDPIVFPVLYSVRESDQTASEEHTIHPYWDDPKVMVIHPQFATRFESQFPDAERIGLLESEPTASHRTLRPVDRDIGFVKLSMPIRISSVQRMITKENAYDCVLLSDRIGAMIHRAPFGFYPDILARITGSWSFIVRNPDPIPSVPESTVLPMVGLVARDQRTGDDPLIVQIAQDSGRTSEDVLLDDIVDPLLRSWRFLVEHVGIVPQLHAQNLVAEYDSGQGSIVRLDMRDYSSMRRTSIETSGDLDRQLSLSYDFITGYLFLDRALAELHPWIDPKRAEQRISALHREIIGPAQFPMREFQVHYNGLGPERRIIETQLPPKYR